MRFVTQKLNCEVKYKKMSETKLVPRPEILMKTAKGKRVLPKRVANNGQLLEGFYWKYIDEDGNEVSKGDIHYFQIDDKGDEHEVSPFQRTKEIKVVKEASAASIDDFLITSTYELYHVEDSIVSALYEEAERFWRQNLIGIALFSWGNGFVQYYALVQPIRVKDGFVWTMKLTQTRLQYQHVMDIPPAKTPTKKPPELVVLPPIEAL